MDHPVLAALTRLPLGHHRDQVQGGLDRQRRVRGLPFGHLTFQAPQHLILGVLAQRPHLFGALVAVVGDDALPRQDRTRQHRRGFHRPAVLFSKLWVLAGVVLARGSDFSGRGGLLPFGLLGGLLALRCFFGFGRSRRRGSRDLRGGRRNGGC